MDERVELGPVDSLGHDSTKLGIAARSSERADRYLGQRGRSWASGLDARVELSQGPIAVHVERDDDRAALGLAQQELDGRRIVNPHEPTYEAPLIRP